ncbi:bifunctional folylpolyglutamate synthase/dihydrofolate synthase [Maribacter sp. 2210JD10-5]|uniref:bifunctional folylpolyglutamate synthase/dihydrofolate synthase n=1 Tax=Maribacter sp. 2210JD10-5 TaxID=3386272 RepID=UPI0039BD734C
MTYAQTLDWMFAQLPMYQQKGKTAFNGKLNGIKGLTQHLGNPHKNFKSIHVAGTNGKGSSSHMLASILQEAGYCVGLYTSPHLKDFRERIRLNGKPVSKKFVIDFIADNKLFFEQNKLSFFEMTVGMAFSFFEEKKVDIAVIEVGLGGRLDSTNIIVPEVSLITNIGMDHMDMLGDTLEKIAFEKAGIIKENTPVVVSEFQSEIASVFKEVSDAKNAKLIFADKKEHPQYETSLLGNYQQKNIRGVIETLKLLKRFQINKDHITNGLQKVQENTGILGRWQILGHDPKIICDTAHNKEGLSLVLDQLDTEIFEVLHLVLGFVKDKDLSNILPLLPKKAEYYFCKPSIPRGLDANLLAQQAENHTLKSSIYDSVKAALAAAKEKAHKDDLIFVGGSNFTVAEVL